MGEKSWFLAVIRLFIYIVFGHVVQAIFLNGSFSCLVEIFTIFIRCNQKVCNFLIWRVRVKISFDNVIKSSNTKKIQGGLVVGVI